MSDSERDWCRDFDHHDPDFVAEPWPILDDLRDKCPVVHSNRYGGFWLLSRHEDVNSAARTPGDFTSTVPGVTSIPPIQGSRTEPHLPIELDPPEHSRYRSLISPVFRRQRVEDLRPTIEKRADELLDGILARPTAELVADFAVPISLHTLGTLMSLPPEDQKRLHGWVERMFEGSINDPEDRTLAKQEYAEYLRQLVAGKARESSDDFFGLLLDSEVDGHRLTEEEVVRFAVVLLIAGHETTAKSMGMSLHFLAAHREKRRELFSNPGTIPTAVEELLRLFPPIILFGRNATRDIELHGQRIAAGDVVALGYGASNRDPAVFSNPDEAQWDRKPNPHLTFGYGPHLCVGAHVARLEMTVMLERFAERLPEFSLDPDHEVIWKARGDQRGLTSLHVRIED